MKVLMMANVGYQILSWDVSQTLQSRDYKSPPLVIYEEDDEAMGIWQNGKSKNAGRFSNLQRTESHEHIECE